MPFIVRSLSARGQLILEPRPPSAVSKKTRLYLGRELVAEAFDTIGRVEHPFVLAKPRTPNPAALVGQTLNEQPSPALRGR